MAEKRTAHAYAQALLELATESWLKGLRLAHRRLREQDLAGQLGAGGLSAEELTKLLAPVTGDLPPPVGAFVRALVRDGDLNKLDAIVSEFQALVTRRSQYVLAHVTSAVALTDDERKKLEKNLARRFGDEVETEYELDPLLLGGVVVRVGDEVIDGSLAGKLAGLREKLVA